MWLDIRSSCGQVAVKLRSSGHGSILRAQDDMVAAGCARRGEKHMDMVSGLGIFNHKLLHVQFIAPQGLVTYLPTLVS
jgi:hypothetical protein